MEIEKQWESKLKINSQEEKYDLCCLTSPTVQNLPENRHCNGQKSLQVLDLACH
jgi:hypothetical protein